MIELKSKELIINFIIQHYYIYAPFKSMTTRSTFNNEAISLSLVSKEFFEIVSTSLTNQVLKFSNYNVLSPLIDNQGNRVFKLIRNLQDSSKPFRLLKRYKTLQSYESDKCSCEFKNVMVDINGHSDSMKVLKKINTYPSGHSFNIRVTSDQRDSIREVKEFLEIDIPKSINSINKVTIDGVFKSDLIEEFHDQLTNKIIQLKPKKIAYNARDLTGRHFQYSTLFYSSAQVIKFDVGDHQEPNSISAVGEKLKKLFFYTTFHDIIRLANHEYKRDSTCHLFDHLVHGSFKNDVEKAAEIFVQNMQNLSQLPNLSSLGFGNFCTARNCLDSCHNKYHNGKAKAPLDLSVISDGFSKLLNNSKSKLTRLDLQMFDFIDANLLKVFESNKTIRDISLLNMDIEPFFKHVLNTNRTIRNVYFEDRGKFSSIIDKCANKIDLHSITVYCNERESIKSYSKLLKDHKNFKLKELILVVSSNDKTQSKSYQRIINNVVLTVI